MNVIKSLHSSLTQRHFQYNNKYFSSISVYWGFKLSSGVPVLEQEYWTTIAKYLDGSSPIDEGMVKKQPEYLIFGDAISACQQPVSSLMVDVIFANSNKSVLVTGDRQWQGEGAFKYISEPLTFTEMRLDFNHAFGGKNYPSNPIGKGYGTDELPNIEYPKQVLTSPKSTALPASFSSQNVDWPDRKSLAGTYDQHYIENYMPGLAPDIDWHYFNTAPKDQWLASPLTGFETFKLTNLNRQYPKLEGQLPGVLARAFIEQQIKPDNESNTVPLNEQENHQDLAFKEVPLTLDTVYFFPNDNLGIVVHRGSCEIAHPFGKDIKKLLLTHENINDAARSLKHYQQEMAKRTDPENSWKYLLDTSPLLPLSCACGLKSMVQTAIVENEMAQGDNLKAFAEHKADEANAQIEKQLEKTYLELDKQGCTEQAEQIKKTLNPSENSSLENIEDENIKKMLAIQKKILPDADKLKNELDLAQINLEAMDELAEHSQAMADEQEKKSIKQLEAQIAELKKSKYMVGVPDVIRKLELMLEELTLLPKLPRVNREDFSESVTVQQQSVDKQLATLKDPEVLQHLNDEQKAKLKMAEQSLLDLNVEQQQQEAITFMDDSYLQSAHFIAAARSPHQGEESQRISVLLSEFKQNKPITMKDVAFACLKNESLKGINLTQGLLEYTQFTQCDFSNAILDKVNFAHADLTDCDFSHASMVGVNLGAATINNCTFSGQKFTEATFAKSHIKSSVFIQCDFGERMDAWLETEFVDCHFKACDFSHYNFIELNILSCIFENCTFDSTNFVKGAQTACRFIHCKMKAVNFVSPDMNNASFVHSTLENVRFVAGAKLNDCYFNNAQLTACNLRETELNRADFSHATLNQCDFGDAILFNAKFDKSTAIQSQFMECNLQKSTFVRANMMEASLMQADIRRCDFREANLYSVSFLNAILAETEFSGANLDNTILKDWRP